MCDLNPNSVIDWNSRPRRTVKQPLRYWTEYVETDKWYIAELLADVPESEMFAACEDDNFDEDSASSVHSEVVEDDDYVTDDSSEVEEDDAEDDSEDTGEENTCEDEDDCNESEAG